MRQIRHWYLLWAGLRSDNDIGATKNLQDLIIPEICTLNTLQNEGVYGCVLWGTCEEKITCYLILSQPKKF